MTSEFLPYEQHEENVSVTPAILFTSLVTNEDRVYYTQSPKATNNCYKKIADREVEDKDFLKLNFVSKCLYRVSNLRSISFFSMIKFLRMYSLFTSIWARQESRILCIHYFAAAISHIGFTGFGDISLF